MKNTKIATSLGDSLRRKVSLLLGISVLATSFMIPTTASAAATTLRVGGSTTIEPISKRLESKFEAAYNNNIDVVVSAGGSSVGLNGVVNGTLEVGNMSRDLKDSEKQTYPLIVPLTIAKDAIGIIVKKGSPVANLVTNLTKAQAKSIFAANQTPQITNWSQVGGPDRAINIHIRDELSGTGEFFKEFVLDKASYTTNSTKHDHNDTLLAAVAADDYAIGYASLGHIDNFSATVTSLKFDGVVCNLQNADSGAYPVVRALNLVTRREAKGDAEKWLFYSLSQEGQNELAAEGFMKINDAQLDVAVDNSMANLKAMVDSAKNTLTNNIVTSTNTHMPIVTSASTNAAAAITEVANGNKEIAIISRVLTSDEVNQGLSQTEVAKFSNGGSLNLISKGQARGAAELFLRYLRNPAGQVIVTNHGFIRTWVFGDVSYDGQVDTADLTMIRQYLLTTRWSFPQSAWQFAGDVNGDSKIDTADYTVIRMYLLQIINTFSGQNNYPPYYPPFPS